MYKLIACVSIIFVLAITFSVSASSLDSDKDIATKTSMVPNFSVPLVPAEFPFIEHCKKQQIEVDWEKARKILYTSADEDLDEFRHLVHHCLRINYGNMDRLQLSKLHEQYADLYTALNTPSLTPPRKDSSSSSSGFLSELAEEDEEAGQDDTAGVVLTFSNAAAGIRHRHSPPGSSSVAVK